MHLVLRANAKKNFIICVWWDGKERERDRDGERDEGEIQLKLYTIENRKFSPKIQISRI